MTVGDEVLEGVGAAAAGRRCCPGCWAAGGAADVVPSPVTLGCAGDAMVLQISLPLIAAVVVVVVVRTALAGRTKTTTTTTRSDRNNEHLFF
jgi:hypothetical protein